MKTRIIIARHGNTFRKGETPTRVGAKTDLPLVEGHRGRSIGKYLKDNGLIPDLVYAAPLLRTMQTARLAIAEMGIGNEITGADNFREIDYGPDENKTENEVLQRLGKGDTEAGRKIIEAWDKSAIVPEGWKVDPDQIIRTWKNFAQDVPLHQTVLIVSSNGIIRFAPYITGDFEQFAQNFDIKVATGGVCIFEKEDNDLFWKCVGWNIKPYKLYGAGE